MSSAPIISNTRTAPQQRRVRVLVADDSAIARQAMVAFLSTLDRVEVQSVCANGRLAVEAALHREPDVVLLDLQMPVMSGLEAADIFRNSMPHVGVIMTSVHDRGEVRAACMAGGADAFIGKAAIPNDFPTLLDEVLELTRSPVRHRRAPSFSNQPPVDLFALPLAPPRRTTPTPAGMPRSPHD